MEFRKYQHEAVEAGAECPGCESIVTAVRYTYGDNGRQSFIYHCVNCDLMFAQPVLIPDLGDRQMDSVDDAELFNSKLLRTLHEQLNIKREIKSVTRLVGRRNF